MKYKTCHFFAILGVFSCIVSDGYAGAKNFATGNFHAGYTEEATGVGANPALIFDVPNRLDVAAGAVWQNGSIKAKNFSPLVQTNGTYNLTKLKFWPGTDAGATKIINENIGVAITAKPIGQFFKISADRPIPLFGNTKLGRELCLSALVPSIAYRWGPHTFGIGIPIVFARFNNKGTQNLELNSISPGNVTNRNYNYTRGIGFQIGYKVDITPCFSVGTSYTFPIHMAPLKKYKGLLAVHGQADIPPLFYIGLAWRLFNNRLILSFDWGKFSYSAIRASHNSPFSTAPSGTKHGTGLGLKDLKGIAVGAVYYWNDALALRAGVQYGKSNIPKKYTFANLSSNFDVPTTTLTCGASYRVGCWDYACFYTYGLRNTVKGKPLPAQFSPFAGGKIDITDEYMTMGLQVGYQY